MLFYKKVKTKTFLKEGI